MRKKMNVRVGERYITHSKTSQDQYEYWVMEVLAVIEHKGKRMFVCHKTKVYPDSGHLWLFDENGNEISDDDDYAMPKFYLSKKSRSQPMFRIVKAGS